MSSKVFGPVRIPIQLRFLLFSASFAYSAPVLPPASISDILVFQLRILFPLRKCPGNSKQSIIFTLVPTNLASTEIGGGQNI